MAKHSINRETAAPYTMPKGMAGPLFNTPISGFMCFFYSGEIVFKKTKGEKNRKK